MLKKIVFLILVVAIVACNNSFIKKFSPTYQKSSISNGKKLFIDYGCFACHETNITDIPLPVAEQSLRKSLKNTRGISDIKIKTAILNPWHITERIITSGEKDPQIGEFGDVLSDEQINDLVSFIQTLD
jgi:hypothetical protein